MSDEDEVRVEPITKEKEKEEKNRQSLLERQFIMKQKGDYTLYYDKNKPDKVAIREYKDCIVGVDKDNNIAIKAIVERIQEKGWTSIKMSGNKALQIALAAEAMDKGIVVEGYEKPVKAQPEKTTEQELGDASAEMTDRKANPELFGDFGELDESDEPADAQFEEDVREAEDLRKQRLKTVTDTLVSEPAPKEDVAGEAAKRRKDAQDIATKRLNNPTLEEKGARENAYSTLSRTEAIEQYPELTPVYEIVGKAREHLEDNRDRFTDDMADAFTQSVRNSCFEKLNKGVDLQERLDKVREQRSVERDNTVPDLSLEA